MEHNFSEIQICIKIVFLLISFANSDIEVRDSRTGYFIPVRYGMAVWPDGKIVGAPPPSSSASSGKCPNIGTCTFFPKWACLKFPEMSIYHK